MGEQFKTETLQDQNEREKATYSIIAMGDAAMHDSVFISDTNEAERAFETEDPLKEQFDKLWQSISDLKNLEDRPTTSQIYEQFKSVNPPNSLTYQPVTSTHREGVFENLPYLLPVNTPNDGREFDDAFQAYTDEIAAIRANGALDDETTKALKRHFGLGRNVGTIHDSYNVRSFQQQKLERAISFRYDLDYDTDYDHWDWLPRKFDFTTMAERLGLDQRACRELEELATEATYTSQNPKLGANFAYSWSNPYLRIGVDEAGKLRAELGFTINHKNTAFNSNNSWSRFEGVKVPPEKVLALINEKVAFYNDAAAAEKRVAGETDTEKIRQELITAADAMNMQFIQQFKHGAPEFADFSDEQLMTLLQAAVSSKGKDKLSRRESIAVSMMHSGDVKAEIVCTDGGAMLTDDEVKTMKTRDHYDKHFDLITANGRTGRVAVTHFIGSPRSWMSTKMGVEHRDDMTQQEVVELRQRILGAKLARASH